MRNNQKGFGIIGILLAVIVAGALAGASWYLVQHSDSKKQPTTKQTIKTKLYTDSAKLYSLSYPETWTAKVAGDCCEGEPKDYTKISRSVTFFPSNKADVHGYGITVDADRTDALARLIEKGWADNKHTPKDQSIHGYDARYVMVNFNGDAENYIDHNYLLTHNGASIFLSFREKYYHQYPAADWSAAGDLDAFQDILNSIKFLN